MRVRPLIDCYLRKDGTLPMKRFVALLIGFLMVFGAFSAMAETVNAKPGEQLSFDISISAASGTDAKVGIKTNDAPVTFVSAVGGPTNDVVPPKAFNGFFVLVNDDGVNIGSDGNSISGKPTGPKTLANGTIGKLTFKVNDNATVGQTYTVEAYKKEGSVTVAGSITFTVAGGTTGDRLPGDANDDGDVTTRDALVIMQWIAGFDVTINEANADCNGDGEVTTRDALMIMQWIAGFDVELV